jgi:hypothetical protein
MALAAIRAPGARELSVHVDNVLRPAQFVEIVDVLRDNCHFARIGAFEAR